MTDLNLDALERILAGPVLRENPAQGANVEFVPVPVDLLANVIAAARTKSEEPASLVQYDDPPHLVFQVGCDRPTISELINGTLNAELLRDMQTREPVGVVVYQSAKSLDPRPLGEEVAGLVERIDAAIERETINLPMKASDVTIETLRRCRVALSTLSAERDAMEGAILRGADKLRGMPGSKAWLDMIATALQHKGETDEQG